MNSARHMHAQRSAVLGSASHFAAHAPLSVNPEADREDILGWVLAEVENLNGFLGIIACSQSDCEMEPAEVARLVFSRLEPVLNGLRCAVEAGRDDHASPED